MRWLVGSVFFLLPYAVSAAVSISEIAWMGSADSVNHEWIELHNDGVAQDVTGWTLSDGANLQIELTGTIPADSYVVMERTSDESASGAAFLIYTGALVNTGATLTLRRGDGSIVDQVSGGEDWEQVGGDNVTKETAQYTSAGWVTAEATPGRGITSTEVQESISRQQSETDSKSSGGKVAEPVKDKESVKLIVPDVTLQLTIDAQEIGYVHQTIPFSIKPTGIGENLISSLSYEWNFGDGSVSTEKDPQHTFQYPGTYVVTVYAGYKRQEQVARHEITILPVKVSLTMNSQGDVQINNDSPYEIDLSGYRIRGEGVFTFPPRTILLPNQTITIPHRKLGKTTARLVGLYDGESTLVASSLPSSLQREESQIDGEVFTVAGSAGGEEDLSYVDPNGGEFGFSDGRETDVSLGREDVAHSGNLNEESSGVSPQGANVPASALPKDARWPYFALIGTLLVGTLGVYVSPVRNKSE